MKKFAALGLMILMVTTFSGCLKSLIQEAVEEAVEEGTYDYTYTDDYGNTTTSSYGDTTTLPSAWPDEFPVNEDWALTSSSTSTYGTDVYLSVSQTCANCTKEEVIEYYRDILSAEGWSEYSYSEYTSEYILESGTVSFEKGTYEYATVDYSVYDYGYGDPEVEIYLSYSEYSY